MNSSLVALLLLGAVTSVAGWYNGLNMAWNNIGDDFGARFDYNVFSESFSRYNNSGGNSVRVWVHFDGNKQLSLYDESGYFKPLPGQFYDDMKSMLTLAKANGLKVVLTLFSFECVNIDNCL